MKIFYIAHARMPTGRAHGLTIVKSCEAFAQAGAEVSLILLRRAHNLDFNIFAAYQVPELFKVTYLPVPEFLYRFNGRIAFTLQTSVFYISAFFFMLLRSRKDTLVYTREFPLTLLSLVGFTVVYECHTISHSRGIFFWFVRHAAFIITISGALKNAFISEGFDSQKMMIAPSGVDIAVFGTVVAKDHARQQLHLPQDAKIALYTGNFTTMGEDKGITDIIHALKEIPDITFVAAGGSESDLLRYQAVAKDTGVADRVLLFPQGPQSKLALFQQAADVLLMPFPDTPHYRNHMSPVKMFEYMASGKPIIASDLPTIREVLNDDNAIIVPPGDPHAIAQAIKTLTDDPQKADGIARRARADVEQYNWKNRADRIRDFIAR